MSYKTGRFNCELAQNLAGFGESDVGNKNV
jgi:hypothetical protein